MRYWNEDNLEGLSMIATALADDPELAPLSSYCALRAKGLRKQALAEVRALVSAAEAWSPGTRRSTVHRLLRIWHAHPRVHQLLPQPLAEGLVMPTLEEWVAREPESAVAQRWMGILSGDRARLETALSLDPTDDIARSSLVAALLADVDHASHHLAEGTFIGDESEADKTLRIAEAMLAAASDRTALAGLQGWLAQLRSLLDDWNAYSRAPEGEFREWCALRGRKYEWPSVVYYDDEAG